MIYRPLTLDALKYAVRHALANSGCFPSNGFADGTPLSCHAAPARAPIARAAAVDVDVTPMPSAP